MDNRLEIIDINKKYGNLKALTNINIELENGIYAFIGTNGAGKTTLLKIITTNLKATSGEVLYNGKDIFKMGKNYRTLLGYMPQNKGYYEDFTGQEYLYYIAGLKFVRNKKVLVKEMLERFNLTDAKNRKIVNYSGGMKQRIVLAQVLLNDPKIIILDEPTVGLDPIERENFKSYLKEIAKDKIIIYCTHIISDIYNIADKVFVMKKGSVVKEYDRLDIDEYATDLISFEKNVFENL